MATTPGKAGRCFIRTQYQYAMPDFKHHQANSPFILSMPHVGQAVPDEIKTRLLPHALALTDTDWQVEHLYAFAAHMDCALLQAYWSRYVIDLNRSPDDKPLYSGATTGLAPVCDFMGNALYIQGQEPGPEEIQQRLKKYWRPYHTQLSAMIEQRLQTHGYAVVVDAHSIRGRVPRLFEGRLPDLNLGANNRQSADQSLIETVWTVLQSKQDFSAVLDGRFRGGFITRHYGQPQRQVHVVQLELAQAAYMDEDRPHDFMPDKASRLIMVLQEMVQAIMNWRPT